MHPPMHALYHLPNLVTHPTPRPISKPTPWRAYASKQAAFGQQRARAAGLFVPGFSEAGFDHMRRRNEIDGVHRTVSFYESEYLSQLCRLVPSQKRKLLFLFWNRPRLSPELCEGICCRNGVCTAHEAPAAQGSASEDGSGRETFGPSLRLVAFRHLPESVLLLASQGSSS